MDACLDAFHQIIQCLTIAPVFADPYKPFILHADASLKGLCDVLYQEHFSSLQPIAFVIRKLSNSEKRYPIHQLEFLSINSAVVDKFHDYLHGAKFTICNDNNPITCVLTTAKLNASDWTSLANTQPHVTFCCTGQTRTILMHICCPETWPSN